MFLNKLVININVVLLNINWNSDVNKAKGYNAKASLSQGFVCQSI